MEKVKKALVVLDLMLPGFDGLEICRRLRQTDRYTPLLILTVRSEETDKVVGLELGADDYMTKPFSIREFIARVKAVTRRFEEVGQHLAGETTSRAGFQSSAAVGTGLGLPFRRVRP